MHIVEQKHALQLDCFRLYSSLLDRFLQLHRGHAEDSKESKKSTSSSLSLALLIKDKSRLRRFHWKKLRDERKGQWWR